jgi:hypothetical protein
MLGARECRCPTILVVSLLLLTGSTVARQEPASAVSTPAVNAASSLRICLRLPDESPFIGNANVRVMPNEGYELVGTATADGERLFSSVPSGIYTVETSAPGFLTVRQRVQIEGEHRILTRFVIMKARPVQVRLPEQSGSTAKAAAPEKSWVPPDVDQAVPYVDPDAECPLPQVLRGAAQRMQQFVSNLEKFTATERVEHFAVDRLGARQSPEQREFEYVVMVGRDSGGGFVLDEFRNGSVDPMQFPAHIATQGLPGIALLFHPFLASDYKFTCEGLGEWESNPAWQVHFVQRPDRPGRILGYRAANKYSALALRGRAWIDPGSFQVLRLETELVEPLKDMGLTEEHIAISYRPVRFRNQDTQLWLPHSADLYVEREGRRYYRRHTFSHFQLFTVETETRKVQLAKESYGFTNETDHDITGVLTVTPVSGAKLDPVSLSFTIPAGGNIVKLVGPGKDVAIPVESVASATFAHNGPLDSVKVDAHLSKESTLDVISGTSLPVKEQ